MVRPLPAHMTRETDAVADGGAEQNSAAVADPTVSDHLRPVDDGDVAVDPGVYRVVGTDGASVTLLRVGDAEGRRVHTGETATVDRDALGGFRPADDPDGNRSAAAAITGALEGFAWQVRTFGRGLAARPLASLGAVVLLVVGHQGDRFLVAPDLVFTLTYLLGVLGVVYLGTRGG